MGVSRGKKRPINLRKSVNSFYIIENIFSLLSEDRKLEIIIYNKKYKHILGISLDYYKKISGKYVLGERNGYGEEFIMGTNIEIFEGNYLDGKKHGEGKEYAANTNKLKFQGEYLKGKKIKGKGYNDNGKLIFELERNGKGKEYYENGILKFKGVHFNGGKFNGKGYDPNLKEKKFIK